MRKSVTLITADLIAVKDWFTTQSLSKLLVFVCFGIVFFLVSVTLFASSNFYFKTLADYQTPGLLTAIYIVKAAIVIILWLGIGSSIVSTATTFLAPRNLDYLLTLPIKESNIIIWLFAKTTLVNVIFLLVSLAPLLISFALSFSGVINIFFLMRLILILVVLAIFTNGIGSIIAFVLVPKLQGKRSIGELLGLIFFLGSTFIILRITLPLQLMNLHSVTYDQFFAIYNQLPLSKLSFSLNWLIGIPTEGILYSTLFTVSLATLVAVSSIVIQSRKFVNLFQVLTTESIKPITLKKKMVINEAKLASSGLPIMFKDWLSIIRSPSDVGYAVFLLSLAFFSLLFFSQASQIPDSESDLQIRVIIFSFLWIIFFATAFLLRLVFPLMAREIESAWHLFTQPLSGRRILWSKICFSIFLSLPLMIIPIFVGFQLSFLHTWRAIFITISVGVIIFLSIIHGFLGSISPNFDAGRDPEKVSTSGMGIIALVVSLFIGIYFSNIIERLINNSLRIGMNEGIFLLAGVVIVFGLYFLSLHNIKHYQF